MSGQTPLAHRVFVATVADAANGAPLPGAEVSIPELQRTAAADWIGEVRIGDVPAGSYRVRVRRIGYVDADVTLTFSRDTVGYFFALGAIPRELDTVKTLARSSSPPYLAEYEARRRMGIGRFITDLMLQLQPREAIARIMAERLPGFRVAGNDESIAKQDCGRPSIYIDGLPTTLSRRGGDATDLRLFVGDDVAGIEYYSLASAPVQFRKAQLGCGLMLIWLKHP